MLNFKNRSVAGTFALAATVLTIAAATPLRAETVSVPVAYGDLDLGTAAGVATLDSRIRHAADQICGNGYDRLAEANCRNTAIVSARAKVASIGVDQVQLASR